MTRNSFSVWTLSVVILLMIFLSSGVVYGQTSSSLTEEQKIDLDNANILTESAEGPSERSAQPLAAPIGSLVVEIGTGTGYGPWPSYYATWANYWENNHTQELYLASELGGPMLITDLQHSFERIATAPNNSLSNVEIRILETTDNAFTPGAFYDVSGATLVWSSANYIPATATGWADVIDINDYVYSGTNNLIVDIVWGDNGYWTSSYYRTHKTGGGVNRMLVGYADSETPPNYDAASSSFSNIRFYYEPFPLVTPLAGPNGSIDPSTPVSIAPGLTTSFTITPDLNYQIDSVTGCSGNLDGNTYTTGPITSDCTVNASFTYLGHTISSSTYIYGTISPLGAVIVNHGGNQTFSIIPDTTYHVDDVIVDGSSVGAVTEYTFSNVIANHWITAQFALNTYTVTPVAVGNGSLSPSTPQTVNHGGTSIFTILPGQNHHIDTVTGCNGNLDGNTYTTGAITSNCDVTATFVIDTYQLNLEISGTGNGSVSVGPGELICTNICQEQYDYGTTITLSAKQDAKSTFVGWSGDCAGNDLTCTVTMDQAKNIKADFYCFPWLLIQPALNANSLP